VDGEAGAGELSEKFAYLNLLHSDPFLRILYSSDGGFLCADKVWADIVQVWREYQPDLLIFDPLTAHHRREANSATAMRSFLQRVLNEAAALNTAVIIGHHIRKRGLLDGSDIDLDRVRDSSDIVAASRSVLALEVLPNEDLRLRCLKNNYASRPDPLEIRIGLEGLTYLGPLPDHERESATREATKWLAGLLQSGARRAKEIEALGAERGISSWALQRAKKAAGVRSRRTEEGFWLWELDK
jgi:hypothetical protein